MSLFVILELRIASDPPLLSLRAPPKLASVWELEIVFAIGLWGDWGCMLVKIVCTSGKSVEGCKHAEEG